MRVAEQSLGHPQHLLHDQMRKRALECARSWLLEPLSADRDNAQRCELSARRLRQIEQRKRDRWHAWQVSNPLALDYIGEISRLGRLIEDRCCAAQQRAEESGAS